MHEARATPEFQSPLLWLDFYELGFLVYEIKDARVKEKRVDLTKPSCMLKPNLEALFHLETTSESQTTLSLSKPCSQPVVVNITPA